MTFTKDVPYDIYLVCVTSQTVRSFKGVKLPGIVVIKVLFEK